MSLFSLKHGKKMVLLGTRQWQKDEKSNPITFVELGDPERFQTVTLIADQDCKLDHVTNQSFVIPEISLSNYNNRTSVTLQSLMLAK